MNRIKLLFLFFGILVMSFNIQAEDDLAVYGGVVISNNPSYDSLVLLEFPFSLNRPDFEFYHIENDENHRLISKIFVQVDLYSTQGIVVDSSRTYFSVVVNNDEEARLKDYRIFNKLSLMVKPGIYTARITAIDAKSKRTGEYFIDNIEVEPAGKKLFLAGTCLAYNIEFIGEKSNEEAPLMYKNGFNVLVNPVSVFSSSDTIAYLYGELFNLAYSEEQASSFVYSISILDINKNPYLRLGSRKLNKSGTSSVITEKLNISDWDNGVYKIELSVMDLSNKDTDTVLIPISKVSPNEVLAANETKSEDRFEDPYDSLSFEEKINLVKYELTEDDLKVLMSLSDSGKINYLNQYWSEHDEKPETPINETKLKLIALYKYANQHFSNNDIKTNGWATDRGRILMTYGVWAERDEIQSPRIGQPYDVWYYRSLKSGGIFVFEDWSGNDDFRLVHSDVYGEVFSKEWDDKIKQGYIETLE